MAAPPERSGEQGLFRSRDGTSLFYQIQGSGRPLLLCYGLVCRRDHWRHQIAHFSRHYQVITFDYRGHQKSSVPRNERNLTLRWCANDVQDLIRHLALDEVVCFGHSMGVPVCAIASSLEPAICGNVFVCGSLNNPFDQMLFTDQIEKVARLTSWVHEWAPRLFHEGYRVATQINRFSVFLTAQLGFNPDRAQLDDVLGYMEGVAITAPIVFQSLLDDYRRQTTRELAQGIRVPTLVIAGEDDCITPLPAQEAIVRALPQGELERIAGGSHNAHMDYPELVNDKIESFLKRIGYR
jgi:pimeloyl-ACP methyl ester carboxylesterase